MKKVLAINSSPRGRSNTDRILQPFLQGAASAGAECENGHVNPSLSVQYQPGGTLLPPPTCKGTFKDLMAGMPASFQSGTAGAMQAVYQFDVAGAEPGQYYLQISKGQCEAYEGRHPSPSITIHTPSEVWLAISRGEMSGQDAMMSGKYLVEGDFSLLMEMGRLFNRNKDNNITKKKGTKKLLTILKQVFNRQFVVSAIIPLLVFFIFNHWGMTLPGIVASGSWSISVILWGLIKERRANTLASLAAITSLIGLLGTIISRNPLLYLVSPIVTDVLTSLLFFSSLFVARPLVQMIVEETWVNAFPDDFRRTSKYKTPWRILTMIWGVLNLIHAAFRGILLLTVPIAVYYSASTILNSTSSIVLMIFSIWFPGWYWARTVPSSPFQKSPIFDNDHYAIMRANERQR